MARGLGRAVRHHHGADALVAQGDLAFQIVLNDIVAQRIHVALVRVHLLHVDELLDLFEIAQNLLHPQTELSLHGLTQKLQRVAISDGLVIEVLVDVRPEHLLSTFRASLVFTNGVPVRAMRTASRSDVTRLVKNVPPRL